MAKGKSVLTTGEVARICNVAPRTVSKWFDSGQLKGYRIPGSRDRRIPVAALSRFMKQHNMPLDELGVHKTRVLLVDADAGRASELTPRLAESGGYDVQFVDDLFQLGVTLSTFSPHVVLISRDCPGMEADELCLTIRSQEAFQGMRLVVLIEGASMADATLWLRRGFDDCVVKMDSLCLVECIEHVTAIVY